MEHGKKHILIVAEAGTSHGTSLDSAKRLVHAAAQAGADCIKFQWVYADEILHPDTGFVTLPGGKIRLYDRFKELETDSTFFAHLCDYVHSLGKMFMCSPFGIRSLNELFALKPDYIKIASPELNHYPMLKELVRLELTLPEKKRIPVVLSSGVSLMKDIRKALAVLKPLRQKTCAKHGDMLSLLHCVTSYPAPPEEYNLALLERYRKTLHISTGVSDHSLDPVIVPAIAALCGARIIEKHITLSKNGSGLDDPVALTPEQFALMVQTVRRYEKTAAEEPKAASKAGKSVQADAGQYAGTDGHCGSQSGKALARAQKEFGADRVKQVIGDGKKKLARCEKANYGKTNRSIHFMRSMKAGEVITEKDIAVLRTEKELSVGISPEYYDTILGKTLAQNVCSGEGLQKHQIKNIT